MKLHTRVLNSPDMDRLSDHHYRACIKLFALGGVVDQGGLLGSTKDIAYHLRLTEEDTRECLDAIAAISIVSVKSGVWRLVNWEKYQSNSPSSENKAVRERVRKYRENKAKDDNGNGVTSSLHLERNELVTTLEQNRTEQNIKHGADAPSGPSWDGLPEEKPDPVRDLVEVFEQASGCEIPKPPKDKPAPKGFYSERQTLWLKPIGEMIELADGRAPALVRAAVLKLRSGGVTFDCPKSILKTFRSLNGEHVTAQHSIAPTKVYT